MIGLSMGAGISFSYFYGSGDRKSLRSALGISFMMIGIITGAITALSFALLGWILRILSVPEGIVPLMSDYLLVIFTGLPALFLFNFYASAQRAVGNSRIALLFMAVSAFFSLAAAVPMADDMVPYAVMAAASLFLAAVGSIRSRIANKVAIRVS